ncbi:hypothetical protein [Legionella anisa]|uniref:hypothetical protein n=1 Tax=Legionella anisa TaxID=28082 RepID=UPI000D708490|nr:hypothetical protein [Legionella anisa]AWN75221.1 hypothetical protein DLD14_16060 [Legionella anisa]
MYANFLVIKERIQSKIKKKYDKPQTPYQRRLVSNDLSLEQKKGLQEQFMTLDPFYLQKQIQKKTKTNI